MIAEVINDPLVVSGYDLGRLTSPTSKEMLGVLILRYLWRHCCAKSIVVPSVGRQIPYKHKMSTSNNVNDVNYSMFIIVHFCILLTRFKVNWNGTHVCNDANLYCTFSSQRQITKCAQYLASSPSPRRIPHNLRFSWFLTF